MRLSVEQIHSSLGGARYAGYVAIICPFHDDRSPSLMVYPDTYRCLSCGAWGHTEDLIGNVGISNVSSPKVCPPFVRGSKDDFVDQANQFLANNVQFHQYLEKRNLEIMISPCRLGYWEGWYTIPVAAPGGRVTSIIFRAGPFIQEQYGVRYWCREKPNLYVPHWGYANTKEDLYIVFGIFDALALSLCGYFVCTSTHGKSGFKPEWFDQWRKKIHIIPDKNHVKNDEHETARMLATSLGWRADVISLHYDQYADTTDPADILQKFGTSTLEGAISEAS